MKLTLIKPDTKTRLQCQHCHLTITSDELGSSFCPECFEKTGKKRYDFNSVSTPKSEEVRYRCESCGIVIAC
jgi:predicted RNA-binding Zn-ribbon protein involved in translation (DUF1610 family)